ncbi:hypothetical protein TSUD_189510 [Trifolium subterraneum]|uniref:Retrotransposon gag domain-containing protein n=1 Tax=Trifolium subterraneum TaxID=3900 RepID=A0A2Z6LQL1_TRISU|nr:hypothetical protein TSUD_189510 [Trifolium subterraneum]
MAGANHEFVGENNPPNPQNQSDGVETSVTPEGSAAHAQVTPLDVSLPHHVPPPEDPLVVPQVPQGAPMEVVMAAPVNTINRQGQLLREQADNMCGQNELICEQNLRIRAVEDSRAASKISRSVRRHRLNQSPPRRNNHTSPPRNRRSPPRKNNRSPPRNGEAVARAGNARHYPRRESSGSGDERHRGPLSRRIMDIPLPRGLEKSLTLDKYDRTTDPDEHIQSVETALDYRNLRASIKCKLFPLSLIRGASTWRRNLPPGLIDSWEEFCRMFTAHFTTFRRHPKTVANLKAIIQGLREGTKFQEAVGIVEMDSLDEFFELAQRYIKWEEKHKASERGKVELLAEAFQPTVLLEENVSDASVWFSSGRDSYPSRASNFSLIFFRKICLQNLKQSDSKDFSSDSELSSSVKDTGFVSIEATTWSEAKQSSEAQSRSERLKVFRSSEEFRSSRMFRGLQEFRSCLLVMSHSEDEDVQKLNCEGLSEANHTRPIRLQVIKGSSEAKEFPSH